MDKFTQHHAQLTVKAIDAIEQGLHALKDNLMVLFGYWDDGFPAQTNESTPTPIQISNHSNGFGNQRSLVEVIKEMIVELKIKGSVRERANGLIELRTQALGSIYGRTREEIETKLTKALKEAKKQKKGKNNEEKFSVPTNFDKFATYWFENFHKRKVAEKTYNKNISTYKRDIQKEFEKAKVSDITPIQIQNFLERFNDKGRTKETIHSILNQIFVCGVKHGVVKLNPLDMCFYKKHEREHGKALTKDDERRLLAEYAGSPFQIDLAIALYTGLRPNEYAMATIDGEFIIAKNSKRKDGRTEFKRIPITPMLKPYLVGVDGIRMHHPATITEKFKKVLPNYTLYDLRTTFQTRCTECGVTEVAIGLFMGNAIGGELKKAYTDVSDEWLLKEGEKLNY